MIQNIYKSLNYSNLFKGFFLLVLGLTYSCKSNPSFQTRGEDSLQGTWEQEWTKEESRADNLYKTKYQLRFYCDSLYMTTQVDTKYNYEDSHCFNGGHWTEYQKAGYSISHDTLFVEGVYAKPNFRMKISGCHHNGNFHEYYLIQTPKHPGSKSPDSLILLSPHEASPIYLHRTQKWVCVPHKLG